MINLQYNRLDLGYLLNHLGLLGEGAEIGVWQGEFSEHTLMKWRGQKLYSIDCWEHQDPAIYFETPNINTLNQEQEQNLALTTFKLAKFGNRSQIIRKYSVPAAEDFQNATLDFVYLDANHKYEATLADLEAWYPKVRAGGLLFGDDYTADYPGVAKAVNEFGLKSGLTVHTGCLDRVNWFMPK